MARYSKLYHIGIIDPTCTTTVATEAAAKADKSVKEEEKKNKKSIDEVALTKKELEMRADFEEIRQIVIDMGLFEPSRIFFVLQALQIVFFHVLSYYLLWNYGTSFFPLACAFICQVIAQVKLTKKLKEEKKNVKMYNFNEFTDETKGSIKLDSARLRPLVHIQEANTQPLRSDVLLGRGKGGRRRVVALLAQPASCQAQRDRQGSRCWPRAGFCCRNYRTCDRKNLFLYPSIQCIENHRFQLSVFNCFQRAEKNVKQHRFYLFPYSIQHYLFPFGKLATKPNHLKLLFFCIKHLHLDRMNSCTTPVPHIFPADDAALLLQPQTLCRLCHHCHQFHNLLWRYNARIQLQLLHVHALFALVCVEELKARGSRGSRSAITFRWKCTRTSRTTAGCTCK